NRPARLNSQSPAMWTELVRVRQALPGTVRVVVLRGEGRAFSAGLDRSLFRRAETDAAGEILDLARLSAAEATSRIATWQRAFDWNSAPTVISIAAVQGHAVGAGFQLALGADLRILAADAQFTMAEPTLGLVPDLGGTKRLVDLVGYSRAADIRGWSRRRCRPAPGGGCSASPGRTGSSSSCSSSSSSATRSSASSRRSSPAGLSTRSPATVLPASS